MITHGQAKPWINGDQVIGWWGPPVTDDRGVTHVTFGCEITWDQTAGYLLPELLARVGSDWVACTSLGGGGNTADERYVGTSQWHVPDGAEDFDLRHHVA